MKLIQCFVYSIFFLFTVSAFGQKHDAIAIKGKKFNGFIFDSLLAKNEVFPQNLEFYNLTKTDVYHAERILQAFFKENDRQKYECCILFPLKHYYRQYYGYYKNGNKVIAVNFIHQHFIKKEYWLLVRKKLIDLDDGGRIRFNMEINLTKKQIVFIDSNARGGRIYGDD